MTPDTAALRALADAATPGPWTTYRDSIASSAWVVVDDGSDLYAEGGDPNTSRPVCMIESDFDTLSPEQGDADAAFIAACDPDTVRALCDAADEVERIRERAGELEAEGWTVGGVWGDYGETVVTTTAVEWVVTGNPELTTLETDPDMAATWRDRVAVAEAERDASRTAHAALDADLRALHRPRTTAPWLGACTTCLIELGAGGALEAIPAAYPCATAIVLDRHAPEESA